jgi:hypothetical protein
VPIHPEAIAPRSARDVDFYNAIQCDPVYERGGVKVVIQRIAVDVVEIEQLIAAALRHDPAEEANVINDQRGVRERSSRTAFLSLRDPDGERVMRRHELRAEVINAFTGRRITAEREGAVYAVTMR